MADWRFQPHELDIWAKGGSYELVESQSYPPDSTFAQIRARLERGARRRGCTARVWQHAPGVVRFVFMPAERTSARELRAGE